MSNSGDALRPLFFTLREIADATGGEITGGGIIGGSESLPIRFISTDTRDRDLTGGALFVALRGDNHDGHHHLNAAQGGGASAALVESAYVYGAQQRSALALVSVANTLEAFGALARAHRNRFSIPMIGITGSYGKTTTRALTAAALSAKFNTLATEGNYNNEVGVPKTLLRLDPSHGAAVVEMGMRGLNQIEYVSANCIAKCWSYYHDWPATHRNAGRHGQYSSGKIGVS